MSSPSPRTAAALPYYNRRRAPRGGQQEFQSQTQTNPTTGFQDVFSQGTDITARFVAEISRRPPASRPGNSVQSNRASIRSLTESRPPSTRRIPRDTISTATRGKYFCAAHRHNAGSALNLTVAITDPNLVAASADGTPGNNANATALGDIQNQNVIAGQNPINYYSGIVFQVGNDAANASNSLSSEQLIIQQLQNQQNAVSGVSLDEEGSNLVLYQNAYKAAARVASTIASLFQTTINMIGS